MSDIYAENHQNDPPDEEYAPRRIKVDRGYFDLRFPTPPTGSLGLYPDSVIPYVRADIADEMRAALEECYAAFGEFESGICLNPEHWARGAYDKTVAALAKAPEPT